MPVTHSNLDASPLPFLHLLEALKHLDRTGWKRWLKHPESVAAHMYRLEFLVMFAPKDVNRERCRWIAFCHDIAEAFAGDIPTYACMPKSEKHKLEEFGIRYIESLLQLVDPKLGADIRAAWEEYENGNTPEATPEGKWVREMDKFECMIQAHEYEQSTYGELDLEEFQGQTKYIKSKEGKKLLELLQQERQIHFQKRKQRTPVIFIIGPPGFDKKTQCDLLSKEFCFQHTSLNEVLREKSEDKTYLHAKFVNECLKADVKVPTQLAVSLLEAKINEGIEEGKKWSLVRGFPDNMEQLVEFKKKVQKMNYTLLLNCSSAEGQGRYPGEGNDVSDVLNDLKEAEEYFKDIHADGSVEEIYPLFKKAVEEFIHHAAAER